MSDKAQFDKIEVASFPQGVQLNTGMYLGPLDDITVPIREIIDNSVDRIINGFGTSIHIDTGEVFFQLADNCGGIPIYAHENDNTRTAADIAVTTLHAGSNLKKSTSSVRLSTHGVGTAAVNAISEQYECWVRIKNYKQLPTRLQTGKKKFYHIGFNYGEKVVEELTNEAPKSSLQDWDTLIKCKVGDKYAKSQHYLLPRGLEFLVRDLPDLDININGTRLEPFAIEAKPSYVEEKFINLVLEDEELGKFRISLAHDTSSAHLEETAVTNYIFNENGSVVNGAIIAGFYDVVSAKLKGKITREDVKSGLVLHVQSEITQRCSFDSQTKQKLIKIGDFHTKTINTRFGALVYDALTQKRTKKAVEIRKWLDAVCDHLWQRKLASGTAEEVEEAKEKIKTSDDDAKPEVAGSKYFGVHRKSKVPIAEREVFFFEGASAAEGVKKLRDQNKIAVVPTRGNLKNVTGKSIKAALSNAELVTVSNILGCGWEGVNFDIDKLQYGKLIIATDQDEYGHKIANAWFGFFVTFMPQLIAEGRLFRVVTPLYVYKDGDKEFVHFEKDLDRGRPFAQKKGLGSLTDSETKKAMLDENVRVLEKVTFDDIEQNILDINNLINDSSHRKRIYQEEGLFIERVEI